MFGKHVAQKYMRLSYLIDAFTVDQFRPSACLVVGLTKGAAVYLRKVACVEDSAG